VNFKGPIETVGDAIYDDALDERHQQLTAFAGVGGLQATYQSSQLSFNGGRIGVGKRRGSPGKVRQFLTEGGRVVFEVGKPVKEGFVVPAFGDGRRHVVDLAEEFGEVVLEVFALICGCFDLGGLFAAARFEKGEDVFGLAQDLVDLLDDSGFDRVGGDGGEVAIAAALAAGTAIGAGNLSVTLGRDVAIKGCMAASALDEAAKEEGTMLAARMLGRVGLQVAFFGETGLALLDGLPEVEGDDGFAIILDDEGAEFKDAGIEPVAEKSGVGVERTIETGGEVDLVEGSPRGAHLEGLEDARGEFGIGDPAMRLALDAPFADDGERFTLEAARGRAWHGALFDDVTQAAPRAEGGFVFFLFIGDVDEGLDDVGVGTFGDGIGERMDEDAALTEDAFVDLRVVEVAGEAGEIPDEEGARAERLGSGGGHHFVEVITGGDGSA